MSTTMVARTRRMLRLALVVALVVVSHRLWWAGVAAAQQLPLQWESSSPIPNDVGLAGMFAGTSHGVVIAAGGANFPDLPPWQGGQKVWHDAIYVWKDGQPQWRTGAVRLPQTLAYGVSVSHDESMICVGGDNGQAVSAAVFRLRWQPDLPDRIAAASALRNVVDISAEFAGDVHVDAQSLPNLPVPLTQMSGAVVDDVLLIAGGQRAVDAAEALASVWSLDLEHPERGWNREASWPGAGRIQAIAGVWQGRFYLFGGIELTTAADTGKPTRRVPYLQDAYALDVSRTLAVRRRTSGESLAERESAESQFQQSPEPLPNQLPQQQDRVGSWQTLSGLPRAVAAAPSPAMAVGQSHLAILGGVDGSLFTTDPAQHPGFPTDVMFYHPLTDRWTRPGDMPASMARVTAPLIVVGDRHLVISGESRPGIRSPVVQSIRLATPKSALQRLDYVVLIGYLTVLVGLGTTFRSGNHSTSDYFLAGGRIPWWAVGISIFATTLSAITYLSIPAYSFANNWVRFPQNCGILLIAPIVIFVYLPFFRRLRVASAYDFLEQRFHVSVRVFGSLSFVAFQIARMGIVLLLPALALSAVTGLDLYLCIVLMGALSTLYTVLGGMEAVVWTDVVQTVVLLGGALIALLVMAHEIPGGWSGLLTEARTQGKFVWWNGQWDLSQESGLVIVLAMFFVNLVPYTTDQSIVQRYLAASSAEAARRAIWTNGLLAIPASAIFFLLGTALYVFYRQLPERLPPLTQADQIFPIFIARELPAGVSGLVIAGVFAAAMSSLDSSMHSIATALTTDFVQRFGKPRTDQQLLRIARILTVALGVIGTATAAWMAWTQIPSLWTLFLDMVGLLGGTLCGVFMLGIVTRRPQTRHAWLGIVISVAALLVVKYQTDWSGLLYAPVGSMTCLVAGWLSARWMRTEPS